MVQIGRMNTLAVKERSADGVYLDGGAAGDVLLDNRSLPSRCQPGDTVEVFVTVGGDNQLQATTRRPLVQVGEFAALKVVSATSAGAYLNWGLESDLFVPKGEQQSSMEEGRVYVVFVLVSERNNRIVASSKLGRFLSSRAPDYQEGQEVDLFITEKTAMGYEALINRSHLGMIYKNEVFQPLTIGQHLRGYVRRVRDDLKIDLSLQQSGYQQVDGVSTAILNTIRENGGAVALTDKSPPEEIYALFGVSKKVFKKAVGALYKKRLVILGNGEIKAAD